MSLVDRVRTSIDDALRRLATEGALGETGGRALSEAGRAWTVERPKRAEHGDYATNVAMVLTKKVGIPPRALAEQLQRDEGLEVRVYGIPAYSTLGWLNWMGGDPLLSTFIRYPEGELARMVFHELAHQVVYVDDDTMFNESYATAVERLGGQRWLATHASDAARREYAAFDQRRRDFRALSRLTRDDLNAVYKKNGSPGFDATGLAAMKEEAMARFRQRYADLKARWAAAGTPFDGYDRWVADANNAFFGVQAAYDELVPAFEALFAREGSDWPRFHAAVARLGKLPKAERLAQLRALGPATARAGQDEKTTY